MKQANGTQSGSKTDRKSGILTPCFDKFSNVRVVVAVVRVPIRTAELAFRRTRAEC
jgi:hypothetical protein